MAEIQSKVIELNNTIIPLQEMAQRLNLQNTELNDTILKQRNEILKLTEWENDKSNYKRVTFTTGSTAYTEKENSNLATGYPYFCQNCYDNRKEISIYQLIQAIFESMKEVKYSCPKCGSKIFIPNSNYKKRPPLQRESAW